MSATDERIDFETFAREFGRKPPEDHRRCALCDKPFNFRASICYPSTGIEVCVDCFASVRDNPRS
jgi:hypothetical protein